MAEPAARAAFLGSCLATEDELRDALRISVTGSRPEVLQGLPGSYAVVLDDGHAVHVLTDRAGLQPAFFTELDRGIVYASDALMLAAVRHRNLGEAVHPALVAARLFLPDLPEPCGQESAFRGVERVGAARALTVRPHHHPQVWPLPRRVGPIRADEAGLLLRDALLTAVNRRVCGVRSLSADLSGGLDSSSLAVLAAQAGGSPVAVTYADRYAVNDEDVHFAGLIAAAEPRLRHVVVAGDETTLPFTGLDPAPVTDEPALDVVIMARTRRRLGPALACNSTCHLAGDGGDAVLSAPGLTYLGDLVRAGCRPRAWREASGWARLRHCSARNVHGAAIRLARTSWPDALRHVAEALTNPRLEVPARRGIEDHLTWALPSPAASWGTPSARQELTERLLAARASYPDGIRPDSADAVALRAVWWHGAATRGFVQIARALGLPVQLPFLDGQVIDVCLAVPAADRTTVDRPKPLLAAALGDRMPSGLLARRTKGDYTPCEYHGVRANARALRSMLAHPLLADLGVLVPEGPRAALRLGMAGMPAPMGALGAVVATETWLRALETVDPSGWWQPHSPQEERR